MYFRLPIYKNGTNEQLFTLLREQIVYPKELCIHGTTVLCFTVDKKGNVLHPVIKKSLAVEIDTQLVHLIKKYEFMPGKISGKVADFQMCFPIEIHLE